MDGVLQVAVLLAGLTAAAPAHAAPQAADGRLYPGAAPAAPHWECPPAAPPGLQVELQDRGQPALQRRAGAGQPDARVIGNPSAPAVRLRVDSWTGEDKFRHAAASWAAMVFTYAGVRSVHDDADAAIAVALPVTAAFGVAKEIVDHRRGGPFSFRDLVADALGAGVAWLFLREMR